jgi:DNA polymerase III sliding clamp (beta) subunit (PCNA family)
MLSLTYHKRSVTFTSESGDLGEVSDELAAKVSGEEGQILFDAALLADLVRAVKAPSFTLQITGEKSPCLIRATGRQDYRSILMPMGLDHNYRAQAEPEAAALTPIEMQFQLCQEELHYALTQVLKSVQSKNKWMPPILSHVRIEGQGASLTLTGTNLSMGISLCQPAQIEQTGVCTIPAKILLDCIKTFSEGQMLDLKVEACRILIKSGKRTFSLKGVTDGSDFPVFPHTLSDRPCVLKSLELRQVIKAVKGVDLAEPICLHVQANQVHLIAAHGQERHTLTPQDHNDQRDEQIFIPAESMQCLSKLLTNASFVSLTWNHVQAVFEAGAIRFMTRLEEVTQ